MPAASLVLKTGREETLVASGTFEGVVKFKGNATALFNKAKSTLATCEVQMLLGTVHVDASFEINEDIPFNPRYRRMVNLSCSNGIGDTDSDSIDDILTGFPAEVSVDLDGTWSVSVPAVEYVEITHRPEDEPGGLIDVASLRPVYQIRHFWKRKLGGTCSVTATSGGLTVFASGVTGAGEDTEISWFSELSVDATSGANFPYPDGFYDETYSVTGTFNGNPLTSSFTASLSNQSATCANGASVRVYPVDLSTNNMRAYCAIEGYPARRYSLTGRLRAMDLAYPEDLILLFTRKAGEVAVPVTIAGGTGSFSDSATQEYSTSSAELGGTYLSMGSGTASSSSIDTRNEIEFRVKPTGTDSLGENWERGEEFGWYHGWPYQAVDMAHADHYLVDACDDLTPAGDYPGEWSNGENCTVSLDGGAVKIVVGGSAGRVRRTFTAEV